VAKQLVAANQEGFVTCEIDFKKDVEKMVQGLKEGGNLHHLK